uniref:Uncharacterized protein n=1 Tax=Chlamydomonas euryale TaxID=1486919 RepID=A0A7R9YQ85_9CHLO
MQAHAQPCCGACACFAPRRTHVSALHSLASQHVHASAPMRTHACTRLRCSALHLRGRMHVARCFPGGAQTQLPWALQSSPVRDPVLFLCPLPVMHATSPPNRLPGYTLHAVSYPLP